MISSRQIKAARYLLDWTAQDLSLRSEVSVVTVRRYELAHGIPDGRIGPLMKIKQTLEEAGIEFLGDPVKSPGVRLHPKG